MATLDELAAKCNYAGYTAKFATYPPKGILPLPGKSTEADRGCDLWDMIFEAALVKNPAFNIYRIFDTVRSVGSRHMRHDSQCNIRSSPSFGTSSASRESPVPASNPNTEWS